MAALSLSGLKKIYGTGRSANLVIHDLTVEISDGEFVVIVGPSGCGKSTLLRMVAGLEEVSGGRISIGERDVTELEPAQRDIAMVFQNYALYPHMSVRENLAFGLKLRGLAKEEVARRVDEAARILGLLKPDNLLERKPKALSGGQRQRVALGRAMVRQPKAFLFDEPLSNLDAKMRVEMRSEITLLHRRLQSTMIYVTHDQTEALTFAEQVVVMNEGEVVQIGKPAELFDRPQHRFVGHFIGSPGMNLLPAEVDEAGLARFAGYAVKSTGSASHSLSSKELQLGIRPEFVQFDREGIPVELMRIVDAGHIRILHLRHHEHDIKMVLPEAVEIPQGSSHFIRFEPERTHLYANGWIV